MACHQVEGDVDWEVQEGEEGEVQGVQGGVQGVQGEVQGVQGEGEGQGLHQGIQGVQEQGLHQGGRWWRVIIGARHSVLQKAFQTHSELERGAAVAAIASEAAFDIPSPANTTAAPSASAHAAVVAAAALQVMECSPVLLLKPQKFLVLLLLSLMVCLTDALGTSLLMSPMPLSMSCMILLKVLLEGCHIVYMWVTNRSWKLVGVPWGGEGDDRVEAEEAYGACDGDVELHGHIPKVHEEDLVEVVLGLVGNGVEEESLEHIGCAQIGEQHHVLAEGMWEGMGGMGLGAVGQRWESREIQGKDPIQVLGYRGIQGKSKGKGYRAEKSKIQV
ncbi:hypothetical protein EDD15DRAFT_2195447 [Pisolithus albus]|nr:hypothetical protein EDD15DRAFT_2195447 [Pisolithus albus]